MDDKKLIKTMFSIDVMSIVSDTEDETKGEAQTGYNYTLDSSLPELTYALAGFLKSMDADEDIRNSAGIAEGSKSIGSAFIALLQSYYERIE